jgi:hypothetical protein
MVGVPSRYHKAFHYKRELALKSNMLRSYLNTMLKENGHKRKGGNRVFSPSLVIIVVLPSLFRVCNFALVF